jgi:hypothetical protein
MSFSYQRGQASLLDYLDAQRDAASQLNLAVGREVLQ